MNLLIKGCTILPMTASESDPSKYFVGNVGIADGKIVFADADQPQKLFVPVVESHCMK